MVKTTFNKNLSIVKKHFTYKIECFADQRGLMFNINSLFLYFKRNLAFNKTSNRSSYYSLISE